MAYQPVIAANRAGFLSKTQETLWDVDSAGSQIGPSTIIGKKPWFHANGAPVTVNKSGSVARMQLNGGNIDVNFTTGEACVVARYPSATTFSDKNPIVLSFATPVRGVGAYVSFVSNSKNLYNGREITASMYLLLTGHGAWEQQSCQSVATTGHSVGIGVSPTAPFVGAETSGGDLISAVAFDALILGNFDILTISRLYWIP